MKWLNQFSGSSLVLAALFSGLLIVYVLTMTTVNVSAAELEPIEPGSPESFYYYVEANAEFIDTLIREPGIIGWSDAMIGYALDFKSMFDSYSLWYDNQDQNGDGVPAIHTQLWSAAIQSPESDKVILLPAVLTGYYPPVYNTYAYKIARPWASLPYNGYVMSNRIPRLYNQDNLDSMGSTGWGTSNSLGFTVTTNWLGSFDRNTDGFSYVFHNRGYTGGSFDDYNYAPPNNTNNIYLYEPKNVNGLGFTYIEGVSSLQDQYQQILDKYPDVPEGFLNIPPPVDDVTFMEEPEEHPGCCHCEVHVTVDVNHEDFEFPTYNVEDVPEPSDFDFGFLETVDSSDQVSFDIESIPADLLSGASFWFQFMDYLVDLFELKAIVILLLSVAFLVFLIVR